MEEGGSSLDWHSDTDASKWTAVAISIALNREPFSGGRFQIRQRDSQRTLAEIENKAAGDAVFFRIADDLEQRNARISGPAFKIAFSAWFGPEGPAY